VGVSWDSAGRALGNLNTSRHHLEHHCTWSAHPRIVFHRYVACTENRAENNEIIIIINPKSLVSCWADEGDDLYSLSCFTTSSLQDLALQLITGNLQARSGIVLSPVFSVSPIPNIHFILSHGRVTFGPFRGQAIVSETRNAPNKRQRAISENPSI
jgi:hypothetical protein